MYVSISVADAVYGVVTRAGDRDYPHHGQWGATPVLAMCGALMRAHAAWRRAEGQGLLTLPSVPRRHTRRLKGLPQRDRRFCGPAGSCLGASLGALGRR